MSVSLLMAAFADPFSLDTPQEESLTYQGQLDRLEAELLKYRAELSSMQSINSNALQSKEEAKVDHNTGNSFSMLCRLLQGEDTVWDQFPKQWTHQLQL